MTQRNQSLYVIWDMSTLKYFEGPVMGWVSGIELALVYKFNNPAELSRIATQYDRPEGCLHFVPVAPTRIEPK